MITTLRIALALALGKKRKAAGIKAGRTRRERDKARKAMRDSFPTPIPAELSAERAGLRSEMVEAYLNGDPVLELTV